MASEKKFLPSKKSFLADGEKHSVTRGLRCQVSVESQEEDAPSVSSSSIQ
jgi:hypothetical protein